MNKDVIYIEPDDDITDIIAKIEKAKEKIVALVPPKKAGVFRSIVNVKLISRAGATADKSVVLVTVDPSIIKLAAATKMPVAKNLQSAPIIPTPETEMEKPATEQNIEDLSDNKAGTDPEGNSSENQDGAGSDDLGSRNGRGSGSEEDSSNDDEDDEDTEAPGKKGKKSKKKKKSPKSSGNKFLDWLKAHKKLAIFSVILIIALIGFLIWAFVFAPAVDISVAIKTDSKNFSESISFTDQLSSEDAKNGKFYLEEKKLEEAQEVVFEATGQKNKGQKSSGNVTLKHTFWTSGAYSIDSLTVDGLTFVADSPVSISWNGDKISQCDNIRGISDVDEASSEFRKNGCEMSARVSVTAAEAGTKYNVQKSCSWLSLSGISGCSEAAMTGGTDDVVTVVQQSDIEKAKNQLTTAKEEENKNKLYGTIGNDYFIIDSTFSQKTSSATPNPGVDQEVANGAKPKLTATSTATVYVVNADKLKEYIREKANLEDDQRVYDIKNLNIENFTNNGANSTAKLKAQYYIGPKITEGEVVDKIKGKGLGDAQREIRDIYGVSDVKINTSYPWVMTIPGDTNKVKVTFEVKDQDDKEVKTQDENSSDSKSTENKNKD